MAYAPRPSDCEHVLHVLIACANPQHQLHKAALTELNQCRAVPTFAPCVAAVFAGADSASMAAENIRELAGIELKNAMKSAERRQVIPAEAAHYIQSLAEAMLQSTQHSLRRTAASIICSCYSMMNGRNFVDLPSLLPCLLALLQSPDVTHQDGGFHQALPSQQVVQLLTVAAQHTASPTPHMRCWACDVFKDIFICVPRDMQPLVPQLIVRFVQCCGDESAEVRSRACDACNALFMCIKNALQFHSEEALEQLPAVLHAAYVMTQQDPDMSVRKSACDIWTTCCSQCEITDGEGGGGGATFSSVLIPLLKQYTPTLIATLLDGMVYSEIDLQQIQAELRDAAKLHGAPVAPGTLAGDDDDDDEGDGDEIDPEEDWTLRKACAKSLDELSKIIGSQEFFNILVQHLQARLQSSDWRHQECALLAIGAVTPGCDKAMVAMGAMSGIFNHIVQVLQQPQQHFLIISIGCWTISRMCPMFVQDKAATQSVLAVLCNYLGSDNTKVRENAVSSMACIIECCRTLNHCDHISDISQNLAQYLGSCLQSYLGRNLLIALDATEQLAMSCSITACATAILLPLMHRWTQFAQHAASVAYDPALIDSNGGDMCVSMLRTFSCVFESVGPQVFSAYFENIVHPAVQRVAAAVATDGESEYYEEDGIWCSYASNFVMLLESALLHPSQQCTDVVIRHDILSYIMRLLTVPAAAADVFAFIGTASTHHAMMMVPQAPQLLQALVSKFDSFSTEPHSKGALSQNSVWAAGKLVVAFIRLQLPLVGSGNVLPVILQHLLFMVSKYATQGQTSRVASLIWANAITAVYRIAIVNPDAVCASLSQSADCARLLTCLSTAPLNASVFPLETTAAATAADDHDLAVCGRGCVMLMSRAAASPATLPGLQQSLPNFAKVLQQWGAGADARAQPQVAAVLAQLLPMVVSGIR